VPATLATCPYCRHARATSNPSIEHVREDRLPFLDERTAVALGSTIVAGDVRLSEEMVQAAARRFDECHSGLSAQALRRLPDRLEALLQHQRELQGAA
jgi:hypothetical protein